MKKMIRRKLFISRKDKRYAKQCLDLSYHWIDLSGRTDDEVCKIRCIENSVVYLKKAAVYLGFKSAEDMHAYYEKHKRF